MNGYLENQKQIHLSKLTDFHETDRSFLQDKSPFNYCTEKNFYSQLIEVALKQDQVSEDGIGA